MALKNSKLHSVISNLPAKAERNHAGNRKFFARLKKKPPKDLDTTMKRLHHQEFQRTNCLECANCCKTTGPLFTDSDIVRLAKVFKLKPQRFIQTYLKLDEENDYVLQYLPCPFLADDNTCTIYNNRPKACREYPHTDRRKFYQISEITLKNMPVCPAAFRIVEALKKHYHSLQ